MKRGMLFIMAVMICAVLPAAAQEGKNLIVNGGVELDADNNGLPDGWSGVSDGAHVWEWFLELSAGRGSNGFGPNPISWLDLLPWTTMTGTITRPAEIEAILAVDRVWLVASAADGQISPARGRR